MTFDLVPVSWFSWNYQVLRQGTPVAQVDLSAWRERGVLTVGGASYDVFREGAFSGRFVLESNGTELASAEKPSALHRSFTVPFGGKSFRLEAEDAFKRTFLVLEQDRQVGAIVPEGIFTRRATADLPDDMPLPVQAFLIWLTVILWKRDADAGTAAAAAAVTG